MNKKKNGFREWLSDNLRYVILGFAMLVILALLYIGFYFLVSLVVGTQLKDEQSIQNEQESGMTEDDLLEDGKENDTTKDENNEVDDESEASEGTQEDGSEEDGSEEDGSEANNTAEGNTQE